MSHRNEHARIRNRKGFTLIELLVVMVILGMLAALVGPQIFKKVDTGRQSAAKTQIEMLGQALDSYRLDVGKYPTTSEGLNALVTNPGAQGWDGPYLKSGKGVPNDPWQKPYQYQAPGSHGDYDLFTYGADGAAGGEGANKDVNSWE